LIFPSPAAGSTIVFNKQVVIELKAESKNGAIKRFLYSKPRGKILNQIIFFDI